MVRIGRRQIFPFRIDRLRREKFQKVIDGANCSRHYQSGGKNGNVLWL